MSFRSLFVATAALLLIPSAAANAAQVAALVGGDTIAMVDTTKKMVTGSVKVTGISGALVGIDVSVDMTTGKTTEAAKISGVTGKVDIAITGI